MIPRIKVLLTIGAAILACAAFAAPAGAWFETSNGKSTEGKGKGGTFTFTFGGAVFSCTAAAQTYILYRVEGANQVLSPVGQDLFEKVSAFSGCKASKPLESEVKVGGCSFRMLQLNKGETTGIPLKMETECVVKAMLGCELKILASEANEKLKSVTVANSGSNLEAKLTVSGVTDAVNASCEALGIKATKEGKIEGILTFEGIKEI